MTDTNERIKKLEQTVNQHQHKNEESDEEEDDEEGEEESEEGESVEEESEEGESGEEESEEEQQLKQNFPIRMKEAIEKTTPIERILFDPVSLYPVIKEMINKFEFELMVGCMTNITPFSEFSILSMIFNELTLKTGETRTATLYILSLFSIGEYVKKWLLSYYENPSNHNLTKEELKFELEMLEGIKKVSDRIFETDLSQTQLELIVKHYLSCLKVCYQSKSIETVRFLLDNEITISSKDHAQTMTFTDDSEQTTDYQKTNSNCNVTSAPKPFETLQNPDFHKHSLKPSTEFRSSTKQPNATLNALPLKSDQSTTSLNTNVSTHKPAPLLFSPLSHSKGFQNIEHKSKKPSSSLSASCTQSNRSVLESIINAFMEKKK